MKRTLIKTFAVSAMIVTITSSAVFAKSYNHGKASRHHFEEFYESQEHSGPRGMGNPVMEHPGMPPMMGFHSELGFLGVDLLGTVSSVSADKKTITVKDVDGKEITVHVNPFTRMHELPSPEKNPDKDRKDRFNFEVSFSDLKTGDYVAITKMKTETKVIEAAKIIVAKE